MNSIFKKINCERLYLISISILVFMYVTKMAYNYPFKYYNYFLLGLRLVACLLVGIKFIYDVISKKYCFKELIAIFFIGIYMLVVSYQSKTMGYMTYFIYIVTSKGVNYNTIIKFVLLSFIVSTAFVLILTAFGVIKDHIYSINIRNRHGLGFNWTTVFPNMFMYMTLYLIYIRKTKISLYEVLIVISIAFFCYKMTDTKSAFVLTVLGILLAYFLKYNKYLQKYYKIYNYIALVLPILMASLIIIVSYLYNSDNMVLSKINSILSGRLSLGKRAINEFGFLFMARTLPLVGGEPLDGSAYNFVDSSFLLYLLNFGIIFFVLLMSLLEYFAYLINFKKDTYMLLVFCIFIIHSTFDPQLLNLCFNYFLLVLSYKNTKINNT